jgi:hypothetical protein
MPGTDVCLKIGGFFRTELNYGAGGSLTTFTSGANGLQGRGGDVLTSRARAVVTFDVRDQTEYGTIRGYVAGGWQYTSNDSPTLSLPGVQVPAAGGGATAAAPPSLEGNTYLLRAFLQFAGFTAGKTASFYDFFQTSKYTYQTNFMWQEYAGVGVNTFAYTQDLGNGISTSVALQDNTQFAHPVKDLNVAVAGNIGGFATVFPILTAGGPTNGPWDNTGNQVPDIIANLRVDQAWGSAQIAGGLHDNRARYYDTSGNGLIGGAAYPADKWGYAASAGMDINLPFWSKGDTFAIQTQYCKGWSESCYDNSGTRQSDLAWGFSNSHKIGLGWVDDAYLANTPGAGASQLQLPQMWNVVAAVQHYWVPNIRTSLYGAYVTYNADSSAVDTLVCTPNGFGAGCANWAAWQIGSRTIWNPVKNLDLGVEALYSDLTKSAFSGSTVSFMQTAGTPLLNTYNVGSVHTVSGIVRAQYNFLP